MKFKKPAITINQQLELLQERGLTISDLKLAKQCLSNISYYRLGEYWYVMQDDKEKHTFKLNSDFNDVIALYKFDEALRMLVFEVISKIEISLRTKLIYHLSLEYDAWWFQNFELFTDSMALVKTLSKIEEEISRSKDNYIKKHRKKYKEDKRFPPAWKSLEQTSLGGLSKLYGNLKNDLKVKDTIAIELGAVNHTYLPSWLQAISQIRNYCAHHTRLWNKNLPSTVKLLSKPPFAWIKNIKDVPKQHEFNKLYIHLCLMKYLLNIIDPKNNFSSRLSFIFTNYPNVDENALGMKPNWRNEPVWMN